MTLCRYDGWMTTLQNRYLKFRQDKKELESEAAIPAQRMLDFLRRVKPINYVDYRLTGELTKDTLERFVLETDSSKGLHYRVMDVDERSGKWEYFTVPFTYLESPDEWEQKIEAVVKADRKMVRKDLKKLFGKRIKKSEYELYAYPSKPGDERFTRVVLATKYENDPQQPVYPNDTVLYEIVIGYHPGFVYDKEYGIFYLDGWIDSASSVAELVRTRPHLARARIFNGT